MYKQLLASLLGLILLSSATTFAQAPERGRRPDPGIERRADRQAEKPTEARRQRPTEEQDTRRRAMIDQVFDRFDEDGDGRLDRREVAALSEAIHRRVKAARTDRTGARDQRTERRIDRRPPERPKAKAERKRQRSPQQRAAQRPADRDRRRAEARVGNRGRAEARTGDRRRAEMRRGAPPGARTRERARRPQARQNSRGQRRTNHQARPPQRRGAAGPDARPRTFPNRGRDRAQPNRCPEARRFGY